MLTLPNLGLSAWNHTLDPYDSVQLAANFAKLDEHDHTVGKGKRITTAAIEDGAITYAKIAAGVIPEYTWVDWNPAPPWLVLGTGGRWDGGYMVVNGLVHLTASFDLGTGGDVTNSGFTDGRFFELPVAAAYEQVGVAFARESGGTESPTGACIAGFEGVGLDLAFKFGLESFDSAYPFNWNDGDQLMFAITYKAA